MQGLGKTERGEQPGRDIDRTSLRSTMPASGPLQVNVCKVYFYAPERDLTCGRATLANANAATHLGSCLVTHDVVYFKYKLLILTITTTVSTAIMLDLFLLLGALIIQNARRDLNVTSNQKRLEYLNNLATGIIFVTTVINVFISFFGSKRTGFFRWLLARLHF
ncbi:unnamed protein product [Merluccius merluccius]